MCYICFFPCYIQIFLLCSSFKEIVHIVVNYSLFLCKSPRVIHAHVLHRKHFSNGKGWEMDAKTQKVRFWLDFPECCAWGWQGSMAMLILCGHLVDLNCNNIDSKRHCICHGFTTIFWVRQKKQNNNNLQISIKLSNIFVLQCISKSSTNFTELVTRWFVLRALYWWCVN